MPDITVYINGKEVTDRSEAYTGDQLNIYVEICVDTDISFSGYLLLSASSGGYAWTVGTYSVGLNLFILRCTGNNFYMTMPNDDLTLTFSLWDENMNNVLRKEYTITNISPSPTPSTSELTVYVTNQYGAPINNAEVTINSKSCTTESGTCIFKNLKMNKTYTVTVSYKNHRKSFNIFVNIPYQAQQVILNLSQSELIEMGFSIPAGINLPDLSAFINWLNSGIGWWTRNWPYIAIGAAAFILLLAYVSKPKTVIVSPIP